MNEGLLSAAKRVLENNWTGQFTKPAPSLYPHQWNWDAGFIAMGYAHYDVERALAELRFLFRGQWATGMAPQIVFGNDPEARYFPGPDFWETWRSPQAPRNPVTSGITMPPVHGFVLEHIYRVAEDQEWVKQVLRELFPKVKALHQYFYQYRDPEQEGLIYIRHPWEGGTDNSPIWDSALKSIDPSQLEIPPYQRKDLQNPEAAKHRPTDLDYDRYVYLVDLFRRNDYDDEAIYRQCPFLIQDPLFNAILVLSNESLIRIGAMLGEDIDELIHWNELTIFSMNQKLWDAKRGIYNAYDLCTQRLIPVHTSSGLMPLVAGVPTQEQAECILKTLEGPMFGGQEGAVYLCPTYSLKAKDINFQKYWRGPVWINLNWMLWKGLLRYDMEEMAAQVKRDTLDLITNYGFYEYFDPRRSDYNNLGCGTNNFSWTAALCIDLLMS